ncbi:hypothetical protein FEM21_15930 [Flavobacterium seoulense]|uniref:Uncharacterized protein n=1 Tax=Flavobacterium seoulense TaxID=1492738 RepID=A0A066WWG0_9FLAO|nr:hypothetical protein FEM21_15930 [Flavobacterium seoulense]
MFGVDFMIEFTNEILVKVGGIFFMVFKSYNFLKTKKLPFSEKF